MALPDFFLYWHHINRYISLYREIQKSSRQNKRQRLERTTLGKIPKGQH